MHLFISNTTRQHHHLQWRRPGSEQVDHFHIPSGHQNKVVELGKPEIDRIVATLRQYGGLERAELDRPVKDFHGILFSVDTPITEDKIQHGFHEQQEMAQNRAVAENVKAALAGDYDPETRKRRFVKDTVVKTSRASRKAPIDGEEMMSMTISEDAGHVALPI